MKKFALIAALLVVGISNASAQTVQSEEDYQKLFNRLMTQFDIHEDQDGNPIKVTTEIQEVTYCNTITGKGFIITYAKDGVIKRVPIVSCDGGL